MAHRRTPWAEDEDQSLQATAVQERLALDLEPRAADDSWPSSMASECWAVVSSHCTAEEVLLQRLGLLLPRKLLPASRSPALPRLSLSL